MVGAVDEVLHAVEVEVPLRHQHLQKTSIYFSGKRPSSRKMSIYFPYMRSGAHMIGAVDEVLHAVEVEVSLCHQHLPLGRQLQHVALVAQEHPLSACVCVCV